MNYNVFDVVKLINGDKATILNENENKYKVEIVDNYGKSKGISIIQESEIKEIVFKKEKGQNKV